MWQQINKYKKFKTSTKITDIPETSRQIDGQKDPSFFVLHNVSYTSQYKEVFIRLGYENAVLQSKKKTYLPKSRKSRQPNQPPKQSGHKSFQQTSQTVSLSNYLAVRLCKELWMQQLPDTIKKYVKAATLTIFATFLQKIIDFSSTQHICQHHRKG